ncbi:hypothetical protein CY35_14G083700 [Sphagnum magellanicum]|nr:hypothetical protein CY35_14G083700 [Sphagnum magellanicum]KAH9541780.1 hypothetical protein CY35_14G083700 [Sphagnum magellanicum]
MWSRSVVGLSNMSTASSMLRRQSLKVLSYMLNDHACNQFVFALSHVKGSHLFGRFVTNGYLSRSTSPNVPDGVHACTLLADDKYVAAVYRYRRYSKALSSPHLPTETPKVPPASDIHGVPPKDPTPSSPLGNLANFGLIALTAAAVTAVAYWTLEKRSSKTLSRVSQKDGLLASEQKQIGKESSKEPQKDTVLTERFQAVKELYPSHSHKKEQGIQKPGSSTERKEPVAELLHMVDGEQSQQFQDKRQTEEQNAELIESDRPKEETLKESVEEILLTHFLDKDVGPGVATTSKPPGDKPHLVEAVSELQHVLKEFGFGVDHPDVNNGFSEAYLLLKAHEENLKRFKEDSIVESGEHQVQAEQSSKEGGVFVEEGRLGSTAGVVGLGTVVQAAESRQAELDAAKFSEILIRLDEGHKEELREAQAQQMRHAEYASRLEKDLDKERLEAETELSILRQSSDEKLQIELQRKEEEVRRVLEKMKLLAKAEVAAAVTQEKCRQLQESRMMQIQLGALQSAFKTQSEDAKVSHSTHKLAMGAIALKEAMMRGDPIEKEVQLLLQSSGGSGHDALVDAALISLPEDAIKEGTWTHPQLHSKFVSLQQSLRELGMIPAGGGGMFTHLIARTASSLKVWDEVDGQGLEALITKVERCLEQNKLLEAADLLEARLKGTEAEHVATEWVHKARNRAVTEQALLMVQSHAIALACAEA